jgi:ornithine cyclodeaminase
VFPIKKILIWNRSSARAQSLIAELANLGPWELVCAYDLPAAIAESQIISSATLAKEPILKGAWLKAGQHVDLIGSFTPSMREADDQAIQAANIYIDTEAALKESGDLLAPLQAGILKPSDMRATFYELCKLEQNQHDPSRITLFKSVGHAVEDLAAAIVAYES